MKKVFTALCSLLFASTLAMPADTLASSNSVQEFDDAEEEPVAEPSGSDNYNLAFVSGDFALHLSRTGGADQAETLLMFLSAPDGRIVRNAQVVTTTIDQNGFQQMQRAMPLKGGYLVDTAHLASGPYRLEAEVITDGWLLADEFHFQKV
jgi:hypothetical protein